MVSDSTQRLLVPSPATVSVEGAQFNGASFPVTAAAEGRLIKGAPFPATVSAEGAQFNVPPSLWERELYTLFKAPAA